jgi:hypothetical protein
MALDTRKLEADLARIFRLHGIHPTDFHGVNHIGICSTYATKDRVMIESGPGGQVVSLATLAQEIVEAV